MKTQVFNADYTLCLSGAQIHIIKLYDFQNKVNTTNHAHHFLELHYITSGCTVYDINFKDAITVNPGEWLLLGKDVYHEETVPDANSGFCLCFEIQSVESNSPFFSLSTLQYHKAKDRTDSLTDMLLNYIAKESFEKETDYGIVCQNLFSALLIHIQRQCASFEDPHGKNSTVMEKDDMYNVYCIIDGFFNQIFDNRKMDLSIDDLAKRLHLSCRHVNRILDKYYGCSFHEKLTATKMNYVMYLLEKTDLTVSEISHICDMSATNLIRCFKKYYQITPAQYRKSYKKDMV